MPIKGLTDRRQARFPTLGKIRKGSKKKGNRFGDDLTHFRFDCNDQKLQQLVESEYGNKPNNILIQLPFIEIEQNFPCWLEDYTANHDLRVRCDGETIVLHLNKETQRYSKTPMSCLNQTNKVCNCKEVGRLNVILPTILEAGYIGTFTMETHSIHDILNIGKFLEATYNTFQSLVGIPMLLSRKPQEISTRYEGKDGIAKRTTATKSLVFLSFPQEAMKAMANNKTLLQTQEFLLSPNEDIEF